MSDLQSLISPKYKSIDDLPYRQAVIGIIINNENQFLIVQMVDYAENQWRFPGGGVEPGETHQEALLKELKEELDSDKFEIVRESREVNKYNWPEEFIIDRIENKGIYFRGQEQRQFLVKFKGNKNDLKPVLPHLKQIKWVSYEELKSHFIFDNQWEMAEKVMGDLLPNQRFED